MTDAIFNDHPFRRLFLIPRSSESPMDWLETDSSHIIRINVPGLGKDDVKIELDEENVLHIKGGGQQQQKKSSDEEKEGVGVVWHVRERGKGGFERRLALPGHVRPDQIKAGVENGVLTVVVPKEPAPPKPKPRTIHVSSKL